MSRIKARDTGPELIVRSALHGLGLRFRVHTPLPGHPDVTLRKWTTVVFVHGCFWHRHLKCQYAYKPKSRVAFWRAKFQANIARDVFVRQKLTSLGWRIVVVWECQTKDLNRLVASLSKQFPREHAAKQIHCRTIS
jgi:DNA mismatch endonuclease, patch repair protein